MVERVHEMARELEADVSAHDEIVHLRRARESDAPGIAAVHVRVWQQAYRDQLPRAYLNALSVADRERFWSNELHVLPMERRPWVAESQGGIVGFAVAGAARDHDLTSDTGEVYAIYVLPDYWERGLGCNLLIHCERDLIGHGYQQAVLWVLTSNAHARGFYEACGWALDGATKAREIGGRAVDEVRYRLTLDRSRVEGIARGVA
jgi:ribosomal protein S18 acetylase RimI-like enzyme